MTNGAGDRAVFRIETKRRTQNDWMIGSKIQRNAVEP